MKPPQIGDTDGLEWLARYERDVLASDPSEVALRLRGLIRQLPLGHGRLPANDALIDELQVAILQHVCLRSQVGG